MQRRARTRFTLPENPAERIFALTDGIFAVAITLLVFNIKLPTGTPPDDLTLLPNYVLNQSGATLLAFLISFVVIGFYWTMHHNIFFHIKRYDNLLLWLNLIFLLLIALQPFSAALLSANQSANLHNRSVVMLYGATLLVTGALLTIMWTYASSRHRLVDDKLDPRLSRYLTARGVLTQIYFVAALILISFNPLYALVWLGLPLVHVVARLLFRKGARIEEHEEDAAVAGTAS